LAAYPPFHKDGRDYYLKIMEYVLIVILGLAVLYFWFKRRGSRDCCG
jgi:hypothetical protein